MTQQLLSRPFRCVTAAVCVVFILALLPVGRFAAAQLENVHVGQPAYTCGPAGSFSFYVELNNGTSALVEASVWNGEDQTIISYGVMGVSNTVNGTVLVSTGTEITVSAYDPQFGTDSEPMASATFIADCEPIPETPTETVPPETPTVTPAETEVPSPTATTELPPADPTTPTPVPTQDVLLPSPPVTPNQETPITAPATNVAEAPPAPTTETIFLQVPEPTGGYLNSPEPKSSGYYILPPGSFRLAPPLAGRENNLFLQGMIKNCLEAQPGIAPGTWVKINVDPGVEPPMWMLMRIPDPKKGPLVIAEDEYEYYLMLWDALYPHGNILVYQDVPTPTDGLVIQVEKEQSTLGRNLYGIFGGLVEAKSDDTSASRESMGRSSVFTALLGPGGIYQIPRLDPGRYMLTFEFADNTTFDVKFEVGEDQSAGYTIRQSASGEWEMVPGDVTVDQLPDTGTGFNSAMPIEILGLATVGLGLLAISIRDQSDPSRKRK